MGILFAIFTGVLAHFLFRTKLFFGNYSLAVSFWLFGVLGTVLLAVPAGLYVEAKMQTDYTGSGFWTLAAIRAVLVPLALYLLTVFFAIWRSARNSNFWIKIVVRYISIFFLTSAIAMAVFAIVNTVIAIVMFFVSKHFLSKTKKKNSELV